MCLCYSAPKKHLWEALPNYKVNPKVEGAKVSVYLLEPFFSRMLDCSLLSWSLVSGLLYNSYIYICIYIHIYWNAFLNSQTWLSAELSQWLCGNSAKEHGIATDHQHTYAQSSHGAKISRLNDASSFQESLVFQDPRTYIIPQAHPTGSTPQNPRRRKPAQTSNALQVEGVLAATALDFSAVRYQATFTMLTAIWDGEMEIWSCMTEKNQIAKSDCRGYWS